MKNELLSPKDVPPHIAALYDDSGSYNSDFGDLKPSDFGVSFLKLVMDKTRWLKPNWGGNGEQPLPMNTMVLSRDNIVVPVKTKFIPLIRRTTYIKWIGKPGDGKMEFATTDPNDKRILACRGLEFLDDPRSPGKKMAPLVTEYVNFYVWLNLVVNGAMMAEPVILSFYRTSLKQGKKLIQDILRATRGRKMPMYSCVFELQQPIMAHDGMQEWPQFTFTGAGFAPPTVMNVVKEMHGVAEMFANVAEANDFAEADEESAAASAAPKIIENNSNAAFVSQQPVAQAPTPQQRQTMQPSPSVATESPIPATPAVAMSDLF